MHLDLWQGQVIPQVHEQDLSTGKVWTKLVSIVLEREDIASSKYTQKVVTSTNNTTESSSMGC